ncbi:MAG: Ig-like domain-containing protein [Treponema sp.]|jgi:pectate lyase|nr:Ig-like domain-containing protein [Treponema sp.]
MQKFGFTFLTLSFTLLAVGCSNALFEKPVENRYSEVTLSIGEAGTKTVRTLLPEVSNLYYTFGFTAEGKEAVTGVIEDGAIAKTVTLAVGTWNLAIKGYLSREDAEASSLAPVVSGSKNDIKVTAGGTTQVTVVLTAVSDVGEGIGSLSYRVTFPADVSGAVMTVTPVSGGEGQTVDLLPEAEETPKVSTGSLELPSKYYRVTVSLYNDKGNDDDADDTIAKTSDIAHIYDKLDTPLAYTFTEANFSLVSDLEEPDDDEELPEEVEYHWNFQQVPDGWAGADATTNLTPADYPDVNHGKIMKLPGDIGGGKETRINTTRAPGVGGFSVGCLQPNGSGVFATVEGLEGQLSVTINYTHTGSSAPNPARNPVISFGDESFDGPNVETTKEAKTFTQTYSAEAPITVSFSANGGVRYYDIIITVNGGGSGTTPGEGDENPVTPDPDPVAVASITLTGATINVGGSTAIGAIVAPADATNKALTWSSGNTGVATVSTSGVVTGVSAGTATITATAKDGSGVSGACTVTVNALSEGSVVITETGGWLETAYVKWLPYGGAASYNVYYKGGGVSSYTKIDDPLIRSYGDYFRADIPGLASGTYSVKVAAVIGGNDTGAAEQSGIAVTSHDRSGFAFASGAVPGAYTTDGVLKANARVIYVTEATKATVMLAVKTAASKEESATGLQNIITLYEKGYEDRPLAVRLVGSVTDANAAGFLDGEKSLMIKGASSRGETVITIEGIGEDAVSYKWGIRTSRARKLEVRNLAFMLSDTAQKDNFEAVNSENIWIHNNDFFYGSAGSASDQVKGDGAMDSKENTWMTYSYNHFWDSGKSSLLGNGTETPGYHTYHHNWFDHSDSRHPRVRFHTVHVYNNLYDGVSKYGIGAANGGPSIFAEANYFLNTKNPMLISMQGTDIAGGDGGTFSSEAGGVIKAYNNTFAGTTSGYKPYSSTNTVEFDYYEATSRSQTVPDTVKTKQVSKGGPFTYNNFDTVPGVPATVVNAALVDTPAAAKANVETYAGRYYGGDFSWTWTTADNTSSDVNAALKSALSGYATKIVSIQGEGSSGGTGGDDEGGGGETETGGIEGDVGCHFTGNTVSNSAFSVSGNYSNSKGSVTVGGTTYGICVKMESATSITFATVEAMTLKLYFAPAETSKKVKVDGTSYTTDSSAIATISLAAGAHEITKGDSINLFYIALKENF